MARFGRRFRSSGYGRNRFRGNLGGGFGRSVFTMNLDEAKSWFFSAKDWDGILDPLEKKALNRIGFILMDKARKLVRNRKNPSRPGASPTNQTGVLRRFIFYGYDEIEGAVFVGPIRIMYRQAYPIDERTVPAILEFGGRVRNNKAVLNRHRGRDYFLRANRVVMVKPRPYMSKAFAQKYDKCIQVWQNIMGSTPASWRYARAAARRRRAA